MPLNHTSTYSDLTDEQFGILGRLFVEWSNIEFLLGVLLGRMLFTPEFLARTYSDEMNAHGLQQAIKQAIDIHEQRYARRIISEQKLNEIKALNREVADFRAMRNRFAHYCWMRSTDTAIFGARLSGAMPKLGKPDQDATSITVNELNEIYRHAHDLVEKLSALTQTLPEIVEDDIVRRYARPAGT